MQSGPYVEAKIKKEVHDRLVACAEITGRTYQSLVDEAMEDFAESFAITYVEEVAERAVAL